MHRREFIAFVAAGSVSLSLARYPAAQASDAAGDVIMDLAQRALSALTDPTLDNTVRTHIFRNLIHEGLDIAHIAGRVLGPYVRRATEAEMAEFVTLLEENVVRKYAILFKGYSGEGVTYVETKTGRSDTQIVTVLIHPADGSPTVPTRWVLHNVEGSLKVIDIIVESASLVTTQKEEFVSVIRRGGGKIQVLLDELRERNAELGQISTQS